MESERSRRSMMKRKPFSDCTNLVPIDTLRKLCSSSPSPFAKPQITHPNQQSKSKPAPKPFKFPKPVSTSSKSDASVLSPKNNDVPNPKSIPVSHPSTPPRVPSPILSSNNPGNGNSEIHESVVAYSRRPTVKKTKDKGNGISMPSSCPPLVKTKDKGKLNDVNFSCPAPDKTKDKGEVAAVHFSSLSCERTRDKGKAIVVDLGYPEKLDKGKAIVVDLGYTEKLDKGKVIAVDIGCPKKLDKGKAIAVDIGCPEILDKGKMVINPGERNDAGKAIMTPFDFIPTKNAKNKGEASAAAYSCPPIVRTKSNWEILYDAENIGLSKSRTAHTVPKKKRRCTTGKQFDCSKYDLPQDFIEKQRAYFKEVDEFELPVEEVNSDDE